MNSEIDLKHFSGGGSQLAETQRGLPASARLVAPPRRIISRYVLPLLLLSGFAIAGAYAFRDSFRKPLQVSVVLPVPAPASVTGTIAASRDSNSTVKPQAIFQAPGWIEPEPYPIMISSLRMGTVESIEVLEGQAVTSGTVVARLVDDDAVLTVDSARSALELKQAKLKSAEDRWANPTSLVESVKTAEASQDKLLAESRKLQEMLDLAQVEANVGNELSRSGFEASLETRRKQTQLIASRNELAETQAQIKLNSATLSAAKERLSLRIEDREALESARADVAAAQAALATAQLQLDRSIIRSPINGTIMRLYAAPGSMLSFDMEKGMLIASIYQPEHLQVRVDVPLTEAAKVKPGLPAQIKVEALPEATFEGTLINIVPEFDLQKNVLPVKVRLNNPAAELRPEMIARVEVFQPASPKQKSASSSASISTTTTQAASDEILLIPAGVLQENGIQKQVYVAGPDGRAHVRNVTAEKPQANGLVPITSGLQISDKIIAEPLALLTDAAMISIKEVDTHGSH